MELTSYIVAASLVFTGIGLGLKGVGERSLGRALGFLFAGATFIVAAFIVVVLGAQGGGKW